MAKIKISKSDYNDMSRDEARKYVEGKQSHKEMLKRLNRFTQ